MASVYCSVDDPRTAAELANFPAAMPQVSVALKRVLEMNELTAATRLLPAISYVTSKKKLELIDIMTLGGGVLIDKYSAAEKVLWELAGKNQAEGATAKLDHDLWANFVKWRQLLISLHMEVTTRSKVVREEEAKTCVSMRERAIDFTRKYHYKLDQQEYSQGMYAKALERMGHTYLNDEATDYRRARPANGRQADEAGKDKMAKKTDYKSANEVVSSYIRKMTTIMLLHGDSALDGMGFSNDSYGEIVGQHFWITLQEVRALSKSMEPLRHVSTNEAMIICDWLDGRLNELTEAPHLKTLAAAVMAVKDTVESRAITKRDLALRVAKNSPSTPKKDDRKKKKRAPDDGAEKGTVTKPKVRKTEDESKTGQLKRLKGGNPDGPPCRAFANGTCTGKCRFSHVVAEGGGDGGDGGDVDGGDLDSED